jgi:cation transport ATPase
MLTDDHKKTAGAIANETGIQGYHAECLPEAKREN